MATDATGVFSRWEILLTGANGFVGKVLLAMLCDRFPGFRKLHVLVRAGSREAARERFRVEVLGSPALARVAVDEGKIAVIRGDIGEPGCGIAAEDLATLVGRPLLVIHCAGLVEFFPPLDQAFRANVDGVENVVSLSKRLGAKLLHVSTCYVCGEAEGLVEETEPVPGFYPRRSGPEDRSFDHREEIRYCRKLMHEIGALAAHASASQVAQLLTEAGRQRAARWGWVNTYTYTKSLGEQIIACERPRPLWPPRPARESEKPAPGTPERQPPAGPVDGSSSFAREPGLEWTIVRPAIVESALDFPFPGWVEGGRTAAPLVLMALGGLRRWTVRKEAPLEVVPVDLVASSILAIAALLAEGRAEPVYQLGTADVNPVMLRPLVKLLNSQAGRGKSAGRPGALWAGLARLRRPVRFVSPERARAERLRMQQALNRAQRLLTRMRLLLKTSGLPGKSALAGLGLTLRAAGLQALIREQTLELYQPFIHDNRFVFETENIRRARRALSERDRELLPWTPESLDWNRYWVENQIRGVQKWVGPQGQTRRKVKV
ncbi:MAG: NAD-dependent epimerase/dehydratase family protein [Acidobacteria bacterium]|nr:NAD-dependent epimerase/dehydratase family protein [Acidobacteriota bacterium]